jgi:hypothetical protein
MKPFPFLMRSASACLLILTWGHVHAGRPLSVEDANVNEPGEGHVETWWAHNSAGPRAWTVAPAWSPADGVELAAAFSRESHSQLSTTAVQVKFRLTASQEQGCNWGALLGLSQTGSEKSRPYANGLLTCHHPLWGSLHANLGSAQDQAGSYVTTRGLAWERSLGSVTLHLESFGQQNSKPARAIGLRHDVLPQLQIDASLGYQAGQTLTTMGLKWMF